MVYDPQYGYAKMRYMYYPTKQKMRYDPMVRVMQNMKYDYNGYANDDEVWYIDPNMQRRGTCITQR
jgi:hypothetical protein